MEREAARIVLLRTGAVETKNWGGKPIDTGADKQPRHDAVSLTETGLEGDEQGDLKNHGGPNKAVCCYFEDNYDDWRADGRDLPVGAFFENVTLSTLREADVFLGDTYRMGTAVVQVTQPRRPCTTVSRRWSDPKLPKLMQETGRCGFYLRVLEPGEIRLGDAFELLDRPEGAVSVAEVNRVMNVDRTEREGIERLLASPELPERWRTQLKRRLERGWAEDDSARLGM